MTAALVSACPPPILQFFGNNGQPNVGGSVLTQVGGINYVTYQDQGVTPLPNPIPLNSRGEISTAQGFSAQLFLVQGVVYQFTIFDANGNLLDSATYVAGTTTPTQSSIGQTLWPQSTSELAHSITPVNYYYYYGNVLRYGADPTGIADSTGAINNALLANTRAYAPAGTYLTSSSLTMQSGQTFYGDSLGASIINAQSTITAITMASCVGTTLRDITVSIQGTTQGATKTAAIYLQSSQYCLIERCEIVMVAQYLFGIWLDTSSNCIIRNNVVAGTLATGLDNSANIIIYNQVSSTLGALYNIIEGNQCFAATEFGIGIEDPDFATAGSGFPAHNQIINNDIGGQTGYGILHYMPGNGAPATDTFNKIIGNSVYGILGSQPSNTSSGAGIYSVGFGAGGVEILNNDIENCCISTSGSSLAPAGIGISGVQSGLTRPLIAGNMISGMTQGHGILVVSSPGGAVIGPNSINMPSTNSGAGPGGASLLGNGITVNASSNVSISPQEVQVDGSGAGVAVLANGVNASNVNINGGNYQTLGTGGGLVANQTGGFNVNRLTVNGASFICTGAGGAISLTSVAIGSLANCVGAAAAGRGLFLNTSTKVRITGGDFSTTGSTVIGTSGACTSSFIDKSVYFGGAEGTISNAGTGCIIEWYTSTNAAPSAGTFAVGDHTIPTAPVVGQPKGWFCTVAGTPGTQTSEGNL